MPNSDPQLGDVYYYPYIWERQVKGAEPEKDRPCCVAIRLPVLIGGYDLFLLALSTSGCPDGGHGIEVPREELARLSGLDPNKPTWLIISEYNAAEHTYEYFNNMEHRGTLSRTFMKNTVQPLVKPMIVLAVEKKKAGR